jgi:hypothetical protein
MYRPYAMQTYVYHFKGMRITIANQIIVLTVGAGCCRGMRGLRESMSGIWPYSAQSSAGWARSTPHTGGGGAEGEEPCGSQFNRTLKQDTGLAGLVFWWWLLEASMPLGSSGKCAVCVRFPWRRLWRPIRVQQWVTPEPTVGIRCDWWRFEWIGESLSKGSGMDWTVLSCDWPRRLQLAKRSIQCLFPPTF